MSPAASAQTTFVATPASPGSGAASVNGVPMDYAPGYKHGSLMSNGRYGLDGVKGIVQQVDEDLANLATGIATQLDFPSRQGQAQVDPRAWRSGFHKG